MGLVIREARKYVDLPTRRLVRKERLRLSVQKDRIEMPSHIQLVEFVCKKVSQRMRKKGWPKKEADLFIISLTEALNNAIFHGNYGIRRDAGEPLGDYQKERDAAQRNPENLRKKVIIEFLTLTSDEIKIRVMDQGTGFDFEGVKRNKLQEIDLAGEAITSGFGSILSSGLCEVTYEKPGNKVILYKRLGIKI